jgi:hypothetical protein
MTTRPFAAAALLLVATLATAEDRPSARTRVETGQFFFPRLQFQCIENLPDKWDAWPIGDQKLRAAVKAMTNINILTDPVVVNLDHPDQLFQYPFVFMTSEAHFKLSDQAAANLREYLLRGGFLMADDCVWNETNQSLFYASFTSEMKRIFPDQVVREVPDDHEIFTCFYKLDHVPWVQGEVHPPMGVFEKESGRLMAICTSGDLHCGWVGFPNLNQEYCKDCIKMGVNTIVYCLTH